MLELPRLSSFVKLHEGESFERDYYITHTNKRRFTVSAIALILFGFTAIIPGIILLIYFAVRPLKISHGFATLTNRRIIYYEYNTHSEQNYQCVKSVYLEDVTAVSAHIVRTLFRNSFVFAVYTESKGLAVGATGLVSIFNWFGNERTLEPGPEALEFIQLVTGRIADRRLSLTGATRTANR